MIGVLALQGDFIKHQEMVESLGYNTKLVKTNADLAQVDKLIIPGGESTTMRLLAHKHGLWDSLKQFCQYHPVFGTCAGAILLARTIVGGGKDEISLNIIDVAIERNSYGRQIDSFTTQIVLNLPHQKESKVPGVFIRAPQVVEHGKNVIILASYNNMPVLLQQGLCLIATFHPELTDNTSIHNYFLQQVT